MDLSERETGHLLQQVEANLASTELELYSYPGAAQELQL